jgi:hypothetical protein
MSRSLQYWVIGLVGSVLNGGKDILAFQERITG